MMTAEILADVLRIYQGSDGEATKALYARLEKLGPKGLVAVNLFRACKASERAKVYRGRGYRDAAYDRKEWSMGNLCKVLGEHAVTLWIPWGWGYDEKQPIFRHVLYVEIRPGQVSFHTLNRGDGPAYGMEWDGHVGQSASRICTWAAQLLAEEVQPA